MASAEYIQKVDDLKKHGKKQVLIISNSKERGDSLKKSLEEIFNYGVLVSTNQEDSIDKFKKYSIDLVFSDMFLDKENFDNGVFRLINILKQTDPYLKSIVMSEGIEDLEEKLTQENMNIKKFLEGSFSVDGYLNRKPFSHNKLGNIIERALTEKQKDKEYIINHFNKTLKDYLETKNQENKEALENCVQYLYDRHFMGKLAIFTEDCATGVLSDIDPTKKYGEYFESYYIKEFADSKEITQFREDQKLFEKHNKKDTKNKIILPEIIFSCKSPKDDTVRYGVSKINIGPTIGDVLTILNTKGKSKHHKKSINQWYDDTINSIVEVNLDHLLLWQDKTSLTNNESTAKRVIKTYKENLLQAFLDFNEYLFRDSSIAPLKDQHFVQLEKYLQIFDTLEDHNLFVRVIDNSPGNSGWDLRKVSNNLPEILSALGLSTHNEYIKKEKNLPEISNRIKEKINELYIHWDQSNKDGHLLEDFFHITDSYEANLSLEDQLAHYVSFMKCSAKNKEFDSNNTKLWLDYFLVGFYRNIRKRHLNIVKYAYRNEKMFKYHQLSPEKHQEKLENYEAKMAHYIKKALTHLYNGFSFFNFRERENTLNKNRNFLLNVNRAHGKVRYLRDLPKGGSKEEYRDIVDSLVKLETLTSKVVKTNRIYSDKFDI